MAGGAIDTIGVDTPGVTDIDIEVDTGDLGRFVNGPQTGVLDESGRAFLPITGGVLIDYGEKTEYFTDSENRSSHRSQTGLHRRTPGSGQLLPNAHGATYLQQLEGEISELEFLRNVSQNGGSNIVNGPDGQQVVRLLPRSDNVDLGRVVTDTDNPGLLELYGPGVTSVDGETRFGAINLKSDSGSTGFTASGSLIGAEHEGTGAHLFSGSATLGRIEGERTTTTGIGVNGSIIELKSHRRPTPTKPTSK